jgi:protein required for attachment to host cells
MQIPHSFVQQYSISFLAEIRNVIILARHRTLGSLRNGGWSTARKPKSFIVISGHKE